MVRILYASLALANGYLYDTFFPHYTSSCSCDSWSKHSEYFSGGKVPSHAGSQCALVSGKADNGNSVDHSHGWPWCFCSGTPKMCKPPKNTVEQLNLQMASADVMVAGFVTYESVSGKPKGMLGTSESNMQEVTGETHAFNSFSGKVSHTAYAMHYVPFRNLEPRQTYYYKVKSGSGDWSDTLSFRTPGQSGTTKFAVFGDMGVDKDNNMGNLKDDCDSETIDAVLHMGDHAYHIQDMDDKTGDGYMNYFQPVVSKCPWIPIVGNHEKAEIKRFDAIARGLPMNEHDLDDAFHSMNFSSTADTALGHHLTLGSMLGRGLQSKVPSGSSRFTSADIGLVHVIALDTEWSGDAEKTWIEKDLKEADANRDNVPWIMVINHYPGYIDNGKSSAMMANASTEAYFSDDGEYDSSMRYRSCEAMGQNGDQCETVGDWQLQVQHGMEPLYLKYGVDIVGGGHHHHYQMTYPMANSKECQKDYNKPSCPVYFTEGNGGVPGRCSHTCKLSSCTESWCRIDGNSCGAYGRVTATKTSFTYDHVENRNGKVTDSITITKSGGPSPPPSPPPPSPPPPSPPPPSPPVPPSPPPPSPPFPPSPPSPTPPSPAPTPSGTDTLPASGDLLPGESLVSASGTARLHMQASDGNLVLQHGSSVVWATATSGHPGAHLKFQIGGPKLLVRDTGTDGTVLWDSGKHANAAKVVLLDSCELVMQDSNGDKVWGTDTQCPSTFTI